MDQACSNIRNQHVRIHCKKLKSLVAEIRPNRLDRGDQVGEETAGFVVEVIEREPGGCHIALLESQIPIGKHGCLPGPRRCGDQHKSKGSTTPKSTEKPK